MTEIFEKTVRITNQRGLHARAAAKFVKLAEQFDAEITVTKDGQTVQGCSIMGLLMLGASIETSILIRATGRQAEQAVAALGDLAARKFDEEI